MAVGLPDQSGRVAVVLREIVTEHGPETLDRPRMLAHLLADLLPDWPLAGRLLAAAAAERIAGMLRGYARQGMDAVTAADLAASSLGAATMFAPEACAWVVGELAAALGLTGAGVPAPADSATPRPLASVSGTPARPESGAGDRPQASGPGAGIVTGGPATVIARRAPRLETPADSLPERGRDAPEQADPAARRPRRRLAYTAAAALVAAVLAAAAVELAVVSGHRDGATHSARRAGPRSYRPAWPVSTADEVITAYFDAINTRNWPLVWQLGAKNLGPSYQEMVQGYDTTVRDNATITATNGQAGSVLLVAFQANGSVRIFRESYVVSHREIVSAADIREPLDLPPGPADFAALSGRWLAPGRTLRISLTGLGVMQFTVSRSCVTTARPPCDSRSGSTVYRGGVTVFQLTSESSGHARGAVVDSSVPGLAGGMIVITIAPSGTLTTAGQSLTSAGRSGPAFYCRPRERPCRAS